MCIKYHLLLASFFFSMGTLHTMESAEAVSSAEAVDQQKQKSLYSALKDAPDGAWAIDYMQKRAQQVLLVIPSQLADIVSEYALLMPEQLKEANDLMDEAIATNDHKLALRALNNFADANGKSSTMDSYLTHSVTLNLCPEIVDILLVHQANPNPGDFSGQSLLHKVCNPHTVQLLVQYKADTDAVDSAGRNALHYNYFTRVNLADDTYALVKALIDHGVNLNHTDKMGETPLHKAAYDHQHEYIKALLEGRADVNATDSNGNTALYQAIEKSYASSKTTAKTITLLVDAGADPYIKNNKNKYALAIAQSYDVIKKNNILTDAIMNAYNKTKKHQLIVYHSFSPTDYQK